MISASSSLTDIAFAVGTALDRVGVTAVLTGGSAATFYAPDAYQSRDLDFVITLHGTGGEAALGSIGYRREIDYYLHPNSPFPLEFPRGPLMVGDDHLTHWNTVRRDDQVLHVLTPTDSCRDRLAAFLFWNDFSGLDQALAVCGARDDIDFEIVRDWCARSGEAPKWELFARRLGRPVR